MQIPWYTCVCVYSWWNTQSKFFVNLLMVVSRWSVLVVVIVTADVDLIVI